jgi:hypothetical protein
MAQIGLREVVLSNGVTLFRLRPQLGNGCAGILLRLCRSVTGLNRYKHGGEKQQPWKKRA